MKKPFDAILLLGLKLNDDGTPREELLLRVREAAKCYHKGDAPLIIPCGGQTKGTPVSEADVMEKELLRLGVPQTAIKKEDQSLVTVENFINARKLLGRKKPRVLVVTSDYHMARSLLICRHSGKMRAAGWRVALPDSLEKHLLRRKEVLYTIDYLFGWQSGGKQRPAWYQKMADKVK